jgi:phage shock protein PspC (stress-responsive transcriptional regulator)
MKCTTYPLIIDWQIVTHQLFHANFNDNLFMYRDVSNKMMGGVLSGIARSLGTSAGLIRVIFLIGFFAIGGITFGISSAAMAAIYFLCWMFLPGR